MANIKEYHLVTVEHEGVDAHAVLFVSEHGCIGIPWFSELGAFILKHDITQRTLMDMVHLGDIHCL